MGRWYTAGQFFTHLVEARRWDAFHSPFLFELFTHCCDDRRKEPEFAVIEKRRKFLLRSTEKITRTDFGAGTGEELQTVRSIARNALSYPFQCRFMSRLVSHLKSGNVLELGTSLGISTAYLAKGTEASQIITVEGDPAVARIAQETFIELQCEQIKLIVKPFQEYLEESKGETATIDLLFLDGHHTGEALRQYYHALKHRFHSNTVVVVDDLYWSADMTEGWNEITSYPEVTQSVDCFHFGLLFFKPDFIGQESHKIRLPMGMMLR